MHVYIFIGEDVGFLGFAKQNTAFHGSREFRIICYSFFIKRLQPFIILGGDCLQESGYDCSLHPR